MRYPSAAALTGAALVAAGLGVATGWLTHRPELVNFTTGTATVFNTALCFGIIGVALLGEKLAATRQRWVHAGCGIAILLIGGLVLVGYMVDVDLGVDWAALHGWYRDDNPHPGRMSPPTAFAFVLSGAVLILMHHVRSLWAGLAVQALTAAVVLIGAMGMVSDLLELRFVYENYPFRQMALATATGFIVSGIALWCCWRRHAWYAERTLVSNEAQRISLNSIIVLASIVSVALLAGLVVMQRQVQALARSSLLWPLESRVNLFRIDIELRSTRAAVMATRPELVTLARRASERPIDHVAAAQLRENMATFLPLGFTAIAIATTEGAELARVGRLAQQPAIEVELDTPPYANALLWSMDAFVLRTRVPMMAGDAPVAFLTAEQRLSGLTAALEGSYYFAKSGDVIVCARRDTRFMCFPHRYIREPHMMAYDSAHAMGRALTGATGVMSSRDERSRNVMAAYGPIGALGLGMVVKTDTAELYAPLRENLSGALVLGLLLVAGGALLLYWRVTPFARSLYLSDQRLKLALESSSSAWWDWDLRTGRIDLSEQWQAMLGNRPQRTATTLAELEKLVHPDDVAALERKLRVVLTSRGVPYDVEHRVRRADGRWTWISSVGRVVERDTEDRPMRMIGINTDIHQRKESALKMEYHATHDLLTGLANRAMLYDRLEQAMSRTRRNGTTMALMYLDIDRFKQINDRFGHAAGDGLLKDFAQRLVYCVRGVDTVARIGGDEFVVILEDLKHRDDGRRIAEKILKELEAEFPLEDHTVRITGSIGLAFYDGSVGCDPDQLVHRADAALYEAKRSGRNAYEVADEPLAAH